ncbi:phosphomannomutase/phosphoglucomutase, partial [Vibrio vulnificus]|nr:phosphomannomutase/phosphoglucomutase [Vibrio vulnificus]
TVSIVARAIGTFFRQNGALRIAVGRDMRLSSEPFSRLLTQGLNEGGCDVVDIGMVPTPVLYYAVHTKPVDGGVMITGSHNPANHNG